MNTKIFKINALSVDKKAINDCAKIIKQGGLVAFPTETVYGIGANALNPDSVQKIFDVKGRPENNPLIAHVSDISMAKKVAADIPSHILKLITAFWPGPFTVVLPRKDFLPPLVSAGLQTVAVRCPSHPVIYQLIEAVGLPIVAPSANLSGRPSPTAFAHVFEDLFGKIDAIIDGGDCQYGVESTVVVSTGHGSVRILRPGAVTAAQISELGVEVILDEFIFKPANGLVLSPGMLHKHYAPKAKLVMVKGEAMAVAEYINAKISLSQTPVGVLCFDGEQEKYGDAITISYGKEDDPAEQAGRLFYALRSFDNTEVSKIYARVPGLDGLGLAVYNRLLRAASFNIIDV